MATDSFDLVNGDVRVRVEGLGATLRKLSKAGADATDMKNLMRDIGMLIVKDANPPVGLTGKLAGSIRAGRGKTKAVVRAGGAKAPYAGVIHYGWATRNIAPNPFILDALQRQRSNALGKLDNGIHENLRKNDLV